MANIPRYTEEDFNSRLVNNNIERVNMICHHYLICLILKELSFNML
jgi:hypothetical protein